MVFKVDFAKAYDSVRWDFLDDVLRSFGFGSKWRSWISGCLTSAMASVIVNGSPTSEVIEAGMFKGLLVDNSVMISHLFYADDAIFAGEWSDSNLDCILQVLQCFYFASGLKINVQKSNLMGVGINPHAIAEAASKLGCFILNHPFKYLGVTVGTSMSKVSAWNDTLAKLQLRLSKWKSKTLSIGGRLTLFLKPLQYKLVPATFLLVSILREVHSLNARGIDLVSHCKKRVGDGLNTSFWHDNWIDDLPLKQKFPRVYALESNKLCTVADKRLAIDLDLSFHRNIQGGVESQQYWQLHALVSSFIFSNSKDRWVWDLNESGDFLVKDVRSMIDDFMLLNDHVATRWIKCIPIKVNVFAWKVRHDRLATKNNLMLRVAFLQP
ncbi:RNA-directed DNA polymerase, eukaryota [Tanacetum coccineum]